MSDKPLRTVADLIEALSEVAPESELLYLSADGGSYENYPGFVVGAGFNTEGIICPRVVLNPTPEWYAHLMETTQALGSTDKEYLH